MRKVRVYLIRSSTIKDLTQTKVDEDTRKFFMKKDQAPRQLEMKKQKYIQRLIGIMKGGEIKNMSNQEEKRFGIKDSKYQLHSEGLL